MWKTTSKCASSRPKERTAALMLSCRIWCRCPPNPETAKQVQTMMLPPPYFTIRIFPVAVQTDMVFFGNLFFFFGSSFLHDVLSLKTCLFNHWRVINSWTEMFANYTLTALCRSAYLDRSFMRGIVHVTRCFIWATKLKLVSVFFFFLLIKVAPNFIFSWCMSTPGVQTQLHIHKEVIIACVYFYPPAPHPTHPPPRPQITVAGVTGSKMWTLYQQEVRQFKIQQSHPRLILKIKQDHSLNNKEILRRWQNWSWWGG